MLPPVVLRTAFALLLCVQANRLEGTSFHFYAEAPDTFSYLLPIENLLSKHWLVANPDQPLSQAGRMPGYGAAYLVFRAVSSPETARTLLVCLQVVVSGLSVYYFALTLFLLLRRKFVFYLGLALYGTALFVADWDYRLMTESLATSSGIFYFYTLVVYSLQGKRRTLIAASFWFAFMVFLRPFTAPLILAAVPLLWPRARAWRQALPRVAVDLGLVASLFLICDAAWIVRNHRIFGKIVPFQINGYAGYDYSPLQMTFFHWLAAIGQDPVTKPHALVAWFRPRTGFAHDGYVVPSYITTSRCSLADINRARDLWDVAVYDPRPQLSQPADREANAILERCRTSFKEERPLQYHLISPLRLTKDFFVHAGPTLPLPVFRTLLQRPALLALKLFAIAHYWLILVTGVLGIGVAIRQKDWRIWAILTPFLLVTFLFVPLFRRPEVRMMTIGYPALCVLAILALDALWTRVRRRGSLA